MDTFYFIVLIIIIASLLTIIYIVLYNRFQDIILKLNEAEREIDNTLRQKYDTMIDIIKDIKNDEIHKLIDLKDNSLSSFEFNRSLIEYESKIINQISKSKKLQKIENINLKLTDLNELNIKIEAEKKYYNDNISLYNSMYIKFPSNIIAKLSKLKEKNYFDGKDLNDETEKDFKL